MTSHTLIEITRTHLGGPAPIVDSEVVKFGDFVEEMLEDDYLAAGGANITPSALCDFLTGRAGPGPWTTETRARVVGKE